MIAGHVQMMFATASSVVSHIREGRLRPLAVTTLRRSSVVPDIPTMDELGIKNFDATTWHGLVAPARTPPAVVEALHGALAATLDDAAVAKSLGDLGIDIIGGTPANLRLYQIGNPEMDRDRKGLWREAGVNRHNLSGVIPG